MKPRSPRWPLRVAALVALVATGASSEVLAAPNKATSKPADADSTAAPPASGSAPATTTTAEASPGEAPEAAAAARSKPAKVELPKPEEWDITNTREDPNIRYYFIGLRYRGTVIPQFFENIFVDDGRTVYSNSIGVELDMRKQGQSMIPWITYADYSMGDTLFHQKGQSFITPNYSDVSSGLKALYLGVDELWSVPIDESHHWDFEFGFGVGIGFVFGNLYNDWVYASPQQGMGLQAATGLWYSKCNVGNVGAAFYGCNLNDHTGSPATAKVGNYVEPNWFNGGSVPVIFPHIAFPQLGIRYKPIKQLETRFSLGFSLTGLWFGLSADYGLESQGDGKAVKASRSTIPVGWH
jgi:hypothetical protein